MPENIFKVDGLLTEFIAGEKERKMGYFMFFCFLGFFFLNKDYSPGKGIFPLELNK